MISSNNNCTGCGGCKQVCPKGAIDINYSNSRFLEPVINMDLCVDCGLCEKVCPINKIDDTKKILFVYAGVNKNIEAIRKSTSGGAFYSIAEYIIKKSGVVYGCAYTKHLQAKHVRINKISDLTKLQGSKYVQSDIGMSYINVKKDLELNRYVLFSGTPCQIAGLYGFLGKEYEKLITVDVICHGVSSQLFFDKYIKWYEKKNNLILKNYDFRSKENNGWSLAGVALGLKNGRLKKRRVYYFLEFYYYYFLKGFIYRNSCYSCKYTNTHRIGDITLGDCWGIDTIKPNISTRNGCSLVIVNSEKGKRVINNSDLDLKRISLKKIINYNRQLIEPSIKPKDRKKIIERFNNLDGKDIDRAFKKEEFRSIVIGRVKYSMLPFVRNIISRIKYLKNFKYRK